MESGSRLNEVPDGFVSLLDPAPYFTASSGGTAASSTTIPTRLARRTLATVASGVVVGTEGTDSALT